MNIPRINRRYRHFRRYRQILTVLIKHGFGELLARMGLTRARTLRRLLEARGLFAEHSYAVRMRLVLEDLGPTFIKLGQVLSTRPFLIPRELAEELTRLQDDVPPVPFDRIRPAVERCLGRATYECFQAFEEESIAAASIAQVHRAITLDGEEVVVKIQRPDIRSVIRTDMEILMELAQLMERHLPESRQYDPTGIVEQLAKTTHREMDFLNEARNVERFARNFEEDDTIHVPRVYWGLTGPQVLTLERIQGVKISDLERLEARGLDRREIARRGGQTVLKQVFVDGFFHADPHPGNLFVLEGNVLAPVDFGMMGYLDRETMQRMGDLLIGAIGKDVDRILRSLMHVGTLDEDMDTDALRWDIADFMERYYEVPMSRLDMRIILDEMFEVVRRHRIGIQSNLFLLGKALGTYEEIGRMLDPEYNFVEEARPFVKHLFLRRIQPKEMARDLTTLTTDYYELLRTFPGEMERIVRKLRRGKLSIELEHRGLDKLIIDLDRASNRLSFSMIIAALIIGSSYIVQLERGPLLFGYPIFGIVGFVFAGLLGIWLVVAILRSGRL